MVMTSGYTNSTSWPISIIGVSPNSQGFDSYGANTSNLKLMLVERVTSGKWMEFYGTWTQASSKISYTSIIKSSTGSLITPDSGIWDVFVVVPEVDFTQVESQVAALTTNVASILSTAQVVALTSSSISALQTNIAALTTNVASILSTAQVVALTSSSISALQTSNATNTANIAALTTVSASLLGTTPISALTVASLGVGDSAPSAGIAIKGTAVTDGPTLGSEFLPGTGWTSTGWTGDNTSGWMNGASNTAALSQSTTASNATRYRIAYTITGRTAGSVTVAFGGWSLAGITATGATSPTSTSTGNLVVTPTSDFNGTIILSVKAITAASTPLCKIESSDGVSRIEIRASAVTANVFVGDGSGSYCTSGSHNTSFGNNSLVNVTSAIYNTMFGDNCGNLINTGSNNTAFGAQSFANATTAIDNTALGYYSLNALTTGTYDVAAGGFAMALATTASYCTAFGRQALYSLTSGSNNTADGFRALLNVTTTNNNIGVGYFAGAYIADGSTANATPANAVYVGSNTRASANGITGETVLGDSQIGAGANTMNLCGSIKLPANSLLISNSAPTVSGLGSGSAVTHNNGTASFTIGTGTSNGANTCTITMPAAANGWVCHAQITSSVGSYIIQQSGISTTSIVLKNYVVGASTLTATNFPDNATIAVIAFAN